VDLLDICTHIEPSTFGGPGRAPQRVPTNTAYFLVEFSWEPQEVPATTTVSFTEYGPGLKHSFFHNWICAWSETARAIATMARSAGVVVWRRRSWEAMGARNMEVVVNRGGCVAPARVGQPWGSKHGLQAADDTHGTSSQDGRSRDCCLGQNHKSEADKTINPGHEVYRCW
jgi:hypothetical protein